MESHADRADDQGAYGASGNDADDVSDAKRHAEFLQTGAAELGIDGGRHEVLRRGDRKTSYRSLIRLKLHIVNSDKSCILCILLV